MSQEDEIKQLKSSLRSAIVVLRGICDAAEIDMDDTTIFVSAGGQEIVKKSLSEVTKFWEESLK